jgi:beta-N-acetylhexosaminidase
MGFNGTEMSAHLAKLLTEIKPGGIILFARNINTPQQTWKLLRDVRRLISTPMFLCVDMEGGKVDRFRDVLGPSPAAADVFASGDRKLFRRHGRVIGDAVKALGFNTDFAPVFDLGLEDSRSVLTSRTVSATPKDIIVYAREFLRGLKDAGVLGCGKHFPGLGAANLDSHHELPLVKRAWKQLWAEDLLPYRKLGNSVPFVMVAHAAYPAVTPDKTPASLSKKWMSGILRDKIGYRGLILSDDLDMGGVLAAAPIEQAAIQTIRGGADMFLVCQLEENAPRTFEAIVRAAEKDRNFARRVEQCCDHVLAVKKKRKELKKIAPVPSEKILSRLRRELWELGERTRMEAAARGAGA